MILSHVLNNKVSEILKNNLISIDSLIRKVSSEGVLHAIILRGLENDIDLDRETDITLKLLLTHLKTELYIRKNITKFIFDFKAINADLQELKQYLLEAKCYDVIGKSYYETQVLKKMIRDHLFNSRNHCLFIVENLERTNKNLKTMLKGENLCEDEEAFNLDLASINERLKQIPDLLNIKVSISHVESIIGDIYLDTKYLFTVLEKVSSEIELIINRIVKYVIEFEAFKY